MSTDETTTVAALSGYFDRTVTAIALALYGLMILVVGLQIAARWVLSSLIGSSLPWTINLSQMLLVYITFFGAAVASAKRQHISLELLVSRLSDRSMRVLTAVRTVLALGFIAVLVGGAYPLYQLNEGSFIGALPTYPPFTQAWLYVPVVVGGVLIAIYAVRDLWWLVAASEKITENTGTDPDDD